MHSARQLEMLELMGIDVWQLRKNTRSVQADSNTDSASNDMQIAETTAAEFVSTTSDSGPPGWVAVCNDLATADWLFVCETDQAGLEPGAVAGRLYDAVLGALQLSRGEVISVCSAHMVDTIAGIDTVPLESLLEKSFASHTPKVVVVLGESCAQALLKTKKALADLRTERYRYQGGQCVLLVSHSLHWLLDNPADKAELWADLRKASEIVNA
jgi:uracil-DNA glycosylase family 4